VLRSEHYKWSSYREHIGLEKKTLIKVGWILSQFWQGDKAFLKYKEFVEEGINGKVDTHGLTPVVLSVFSDRQSFKELDSSNIVREQIDLLNGFVQWLIILKKIDLYLQNGCF